MVDSKNIVWLEFDQNLSILNSHLEYFLNSSISSKSKSSSAASWAIALYNLAATRAWAIHNRYGIKHTKQTRSAITALKSYNKLAFKYGTKQKLNFMFQVDVKITVKLKAKNK